jgi:uncharacterized SAM-binding protein YcdF (DUF218 family)
MVLRARFVGIAGFLGLKKKAQVLSEPSLVLQMPRLGGLVDSLKRLYSTAPPAQRIPGNSLVLVGSGGTPAAAPPQTTLPARSRRSLLYRHARPRRLPSSAQAQELVQ